MQRFAVILTCALCTACASAGDPALDGMTRGIKVSFFRLSFFVMHITC